MELIQALAAQRPEDQFLFLVNKDEGIAMPQNASVKRLPEFSNAWRRQLWLEMKVPAITRKWRADLLISLVNTGILRAGLPQLVEPTGTPWLKYPRFFSKGEQWLQRMLLPRLVKKATGLVSISAAMKAEVLELLPEAAAKYYLVPLSAPENFRPLEWQDTESVKDGFADGREYFFFPGGFAAHENLLHVLKAFSEFKKWQQSNMKLLVAGDATDGNDLRDKLASYKFRDDVTLLGQLTPQQMARLTAAAYAVVYPPAWQSSPQLILQAQAAGTTVISGNDDVSKEAGGDCALYADPRDPSDIGAKMILLYKDEALRSRLIAEGEARAALFSRERAAKQLWEIIAVHAVQHQH